MLAAWMRRLVGRRRSSVQLWRRALGRLDLDPLLGDALTRHATLGDAWARCPRVDWAVDLSLAARVEPQLVREGLAEIARAGRDWGAEQAPDALDAWQEDAHALAAILRAMVESEPDVRALAGKLREAERWKQRAHVEAISDQYDRAHAAAHGALADCFRRRVTTDAISVALLGRRSHPYR